MKKNYIIAAVCVLLAGCRNMPDVPEVQETQAVQTESSAKETELAADGYENSGWEYGQVAIGGGGFVTGIISTCEPGLFYARTDVGGAYRWDKDKNSWVSLSFDISKDDVGLLGIDGIAADPTNAANVYMIAGTSYFSGGKTCVMISHDYGEHFEKIDVSDMIKVHGNGMGRGNGERIAVDPNSPDTILVGGRTGGMIRSDDGGKTWANVDFPVTSTKNGNGINIILFDGTRTADGRTSRIYAGVSRSGEDNIYISEDAGKTWSALSCVPEDNMKYMPERFDLDSKGRLYVSCGENEGPWNSAAGGLFRYDADSGSSEFLPADSATIGDIVIDPKDDNRIFLVTSEVWAAQPNGAYGDKFYRSTDGGETWECLSDKYTMSTNGMDWISEYAVHWCSSLAMDSGDSGKVLVNSGNGIFACDDVWSDTPEFYFDSKGIEETVPLDIVSYKDYPLISAVGDYDGFVHEDINQSPARHNRQIGSVSSIAVAAQNKDMWVKVGGDESNMLLTYTTDGGKTWTDITNSPESGKKLFRGRLALTADGSSVLWSPENSTYVYQTDDRGETWNQCQGIIGGQNVYITADTVNSDIVYGCSNSSFYVSHDKGKTFRKKFELADSHKRLALEPGNEGKVYIPAGGMGLLTTSDAGENMALVPGLRYCEAVGTGRPKNDGDPYVIYVWGTPKDSETEGIYMSENGGETWERVNDDMHSFGGTGNGQFIAGDMNVYGRCYMSTVGLGIVYCEKTDK